MGILDDAIRQHLDLKRRSGAGDDELKQLENEAFGPPARPGDPDFPTSEEAIDSEGGGPAGEFPEAPAAVPEGPQEIADETQVLSATGESATAEELPPGEDQDLTDDEPEAEEHSLLPEAGGGPPQIFDQSLEDELDLELDLSDEEIPALEDEVPVEHLETVEHPMHEELGDSPAAHGPSTAEEPAAAAPVADPQVPIEEDGPGDDEPLTAGDPLTGEDDALEDDLDEDEAEDDVLADTPEFLRDQPEDDELWFEQGEPKDFDFD
jgi:hypothetical protein